MYLLVYQNRWLRVAGTPFNLRLQRRLRAGI